MRLVQALLGLTLVAWLVCESQQFGTKTMGPYDIIIQQVYLCEDQGTGKGNFNVSLYLGPPDASRKRPRLHRGGFSFPFTKEEMATMEVEGDFYQRKSNNYLLMYKHKDNLCHSFEEIASKVYFSLRVAVGLPPEGCLIPTGNYTFNDYEIPFDLPTPQLEYGSYKFTIRLLSEKKVFGCIIMLADINPK